MTPNSTPESSCTPESQERMLRFELKPLSKNAVLRLRGVGDLAVSSVPPVGDANASRQLHRLPEFEAFVPGEQTARGIWRRRATFENPIERRNESRQPKK